MVELLAPAGDYDSLKAAVLNGANAVYLGGKEFSARQSAGNFDRDEMVIGVRFCHAYNVKVYVTMNTLYRNEELVDAMKYVAFLYEIGVDALIIQDMGFLKLLKEELPDFEIHGSTQMSVHNLDGVNALYEMGVKRVVLARELSIDEIKYIASNTKAEIEVFIHGALCICVSGQCLFSSMIGGRSGNRGRCAQSCRQQYTFNNGRKAHFLSPKDLSTLEFINEIVDTGVASIKIEGRMKKPEYVAGVVSSYKKSLQGKLTESDVDKVTQLFNRGGFTTFNLDMKQGNEMMSYDRPKNWGTFLGKIVEAKEKFASIRLEKPLVCGDGVENFNRENGATVSKMWINGKEVPCAYEDDIVEIYIEGARVGDTIYKSLDISITKEAEESYTGKDIARLPLSGNFVARRDEKIKLTITNMSGNSITYEVIGEIPQIALKTPTSRDKIIEALSKTKDTPFYFENIEISMDEDIVIPASALNLLRREGINGLMDILQGKRNAKNIEISFKTEKKNVAPKIVCLTGNIEAARAAVDGGCDILFFGGDPLRTNSGDFEDALVLSNDKTKVLPWIPEVIFEGYNKIKDDIIKYKSYGINEVLCGNLGMYSILKDNGFKVFLSSGFNIFNSPATEIFENSIATLSRELNLTQIKDIIDSTSASTMVMVHGRIKSMVSRHCFIGSIMGDGREGCPSICKNKPHYLKDKMGEVFYVLPDYNCNNHIYNSKTLCMVDHMRDIVSMNSNYLGINFLDESYAEALLTVKAYKTQLKAGLEKNYNHTAETIQLLESLSGNITKGHFHRGVQ